MKVKRKLRVVLTDECNFNCRNCYNEFNDTRNNHNELNPDSLLKYINKNKNSISSIVLTGGEPLLYPYLSEIIKKIHSLNIPIQVTTNGYNINKFLDDKYFLNYVDSINISIDKIDSESFRVGTFFSKSIFKRVVDNTILLSKIEKRPKIFINSVIDESNLSYENISNLLDFVFSYNLDGIKFIPLIGSNEEENIIELKKYLENKLDDNLIYYNSFELIDEYKCKDKVIKILHQYCNNNCDECKKSGFIRINSNGNIYSCDVKKEKVKNIYEE